MAAMLTTIWRRHTAKCPHKSKGRMYLKCTCPLWSDGYADGVRIYRASLGTRDMARARKKAMNAEASGDRVIKPVPAAIKAFLDHCTSQGLGESTTRKYTNTLEKLKLFAAARDIDSVAEMTIDFLDAFRASRGIAPITSSKELELLRQFASFCVARKWIEDNPASGIKGPKNLKPNEVVPYTPAECAQIFDATGRFGRTTYERLRARAMVLAFKETALRISDVALIKKDRFTWSGTCWRIFLRTEKTGAPIFLPITQTLKDAFDLLPTPKGADHNCQYYFWNGLSTKKSLLSMADRTLRAVFRLSKVHKAHAHRYRHTLATELLARGASFEDVADVLGNSVEMVRKHYAKWSRARQSRIDDLMERMRTPLPEELSEPSRFIQ